MSDLTETLVSAIEGLHLNPENSTTPHCIEEYNNGLSNAALTIREVLKTA